ncbi:MAG: GNAT family N-acetyltransferase [Lachnospiraceae bacterium]|jgi:ribosomal protein S18 acetylase RimI-like enzyme|nr:GNAT family N-acetyltransferase [Lachnospiraceae bacterium]
MIELLKFADLASYKRLIDDCFGISNGLDYYERYCQNRGYTIFVVKDGKEIIGSVTQYAIELFTFNFQPCLMLFNVAVMSRYRRHNVARRLIEHVIEEARKQGYRSISLTCHNSAYEAHQLYEGMGFTRADSVKYEMKL